MLSELFISSKLSILFSRNRVLTPLEMQFAMQDQSGVLDSTLNSMLLAPAVASTSCNRALGRTRPHPSQILKCPRCDSINTKFCYYNNYNLSQPRHFCKTCRRYWTKGGVLRNVPVGGGCRKNNHNRKSKPRNNTPPADKSKSKSTSNSAATVSSGESSPLTVNNNSIQETTSSSTSFNSSTGYRFGSELGEILIGNYKASDHCTTAPIPRLQSNADFFHQPDFLNSENLSTSIDANSSSYSNLFGSSNYVGLSFSDIQQKLAGFSSNNVQEPCPAAPQVYNFNSNSSNNHINSKNSMISSDWQVNNNIETLLDDSYCWGAAEPQAIWSDQEPIYLPEGI